MKKLILIITILLIVSSCKMTKDVTYKKVELSNIDNMKSFDDAEAWFDSIHSRPLLIKFDTNLAQKSD